MVITTRQRPATVHAIDVLTGRLESHKRLDRVDQFLGVHPASVRDIGVLMSADGKHELELLVAAGLSPFEALQTGTTAPARFLERGSGTVAEGAAADLVLLDANPLEDIGNSRRIHGVVAAGRWLTSAELLAAID